MELRTKTRFGGRFVRLGALLVAAATLGIAIPASAQIQETNRYAVTDFAVKVTAPDIDLGAETRDKVRDALSQVFQRDRETVPTDQVSRAMRDLGLMPPVTRAADLLRLGDALDAQYIVTGTVENWRVVPVNGMKQAQIIVSVQVRNVSGGIPVNAAAVTGKSAPRGADTTEATLLGDALTDAAFKAVSSMEGNILPTATVLSTTGDTVLINHGTRSGLQNGMRAIFMRGSEQVAEGTVSNADVDSAFVRVTRATKGVRPGDKFQTIVDVPVIRPGWGGDGDPKTSNPRRSSAGNQALFSLLLLLVILGFLFLIVGVFWIIQAFAERDGNAVWWLGLTAGVLMVILAFWTSGQFFIEKQYTLLVFAGIWALMSGVTDIVRAFQIRKLGEL